MRPLLISSSLNFRQSEAEQSRSEGGCHNNLKIVPDALGVSHCGQNQEVRWDKLNILSEWMPGSAEDYFRSVNVICCVKYPACIHMGMETEKIHECFSVKNDNALRAFHSKSH